VALAMVVPFSPNTQVQWLAWAFLVVILGGLGKVENTLAAGLVVGLIQTVCTALLPFDYVYLVLYLLLAAILILRREGLIPILSKSDSLGIERSRYRGIEACCRTGSPLASRSVADTLGMNRPMQSDKR
jgi:hypothetical protein